MAEEDPSRSQLQGLFPLAPHVLVYTTSRIMEGEEAITDVHHDVDGDWQFLDAAGSLEADDIVKVHVHCILDEHPHLAELGHLPVGWHAWRSNAEQPWHFEAFIPE
jgi:hypothetical protein